MAGEGEGQGKPGGSENELLSAYLWYVVWATVGLVLIWRAYNIAMKYLRLMGALGNDRQGYFAKSSYRVSWFKRNILYAPVSRKRHNREFQLSTAINVGTLPTRLQLFYLAGYFATNVAFCVIFIDYTQPFETGIKIVRNRAGVLAVVNMVPLFLMGARNNPLIDLLGISFDTYNLMHRWLGRIVILESLAHVVSFYVGSSRGGQFSEVFVGTMQSPFLLWGFIAMVAFAVIGIQATSIIRHAFYETFKLTHISLAALAIAGVYYHLNFKSLPTLKYVYLTIAIWAGDRAARMLRLAYYNIGSGGARAIVEAMPGDTVRMTVTLARPWTFEPGQHAYLYMPSISYWQSHPFSIIWDSEAEVAKGDEALPVDRNDVLTRTNSSVSFIIRGFAGFTDNLYRKAAAEKDGRLMAKCFVEGAYGGLHKMESYGTVVLVAGGVGITQAVPHVRHLVAGYSNGTVAARKIVLVWVFQCPEFLEWIRPWMTEILAMENRREVLRVMLFVTRPRNTKEIHSPSATVQMFPGRPNIEHILANEMENQIGAMGVSVCGPGALSDQVRLAVRNKQYDGAIDFVEEAFSW